MTHSTVVRALTIVIALSTAFTVGMAHAETQNDNGLWVVAIAQGSAGSEGSDPSRVKWWLDVQARFSGDADGFSQGIVRPGIGYAVTEKAAVWLGYAWIRTLPASGGNLDEHQVWEQLTWSSRLNQINFLSRTRLEQRFRDGGDDTGWRLRQFFKFTYPLPNKPSVSLVGYDELFFALNNTDWGAESGFDRNRLFLGAA